MLVNVEDFLPAWLARTMNCNVYCSCLVTMRLLLTTHYTGVYCLQFFVSNFFFPQSVNEQRRNNFLSVDKYLGHNACNAYFVRGFYSQILTAILESCRLLLKEFLFKFQIE